MWVNLFVGQLETEVARSERQDVRACKKARKPSGRGGAVDVNYTRRFSKTRDLRCPVRSDGE